MKRGEEEEKGGGGGGRGVMRNYDEEECDWGTERGGEKKRGCVRISEIIIEATSPRAYCTVQKVASRTHTHTHTHAMYGCTPFSQF